MSNPPDSVTHQDAAGLDMKAILDGEAIRDKVIDLIDAYSAGDSILGPRLLVIRDDLGKHLRHLRGADT